MAKKVNTRMTGADYRRELEEIEARKRSLQSHVLERLKNLIKLYPNAQFHDVNEELTASLLTDSHIEGFSTAVKIRLIENIEKWSEKQQGVQQLKI
jgi:hypothetical protein